MHRPFNRILTIQDAYRESVKALQWSSRLVPGSGKVKLLDVQPPLSALWQEMFNDDAERSPIQHRKNSLEEMTRQVEFPTSDVAFQVRSGTPVVEIVREAIEWHCDLVVKEAYSKASDFIFGSLDMRLLRNCPKPVWLAHPKSPSHCTRILVALNPEAGEKEMRLNKRLVNYASMVARGFNCKLFVVGACVSQGTSFPILDRASMSRFELQSKRIASQARDVIDKLLQESLKPVDRDDVIIEEGSPDEVILDAVQEVEPELLVMGSVARHGVSGLLVGNAAERVLQQVDCSVLAIKPLDFVSPIQKVEPEGGGAASGVFAY